MIDLDKTYCSSYKQCSNYKCKRRLPDNYNGNSNIWWQDFNKDYNKGEPCKDFIFNRDEFVYTTNVVIKYVVENYSNDIFDTIVQNEHYTKILHYLVNWKYAITHFKCFAGSNIFYVGSYGIDCDNDVICGFKLDDKVIKSIEHICNIIKDMNINEFVKLYNSTYPILSSEIYCKFDIVEKAKEYKGV